MAAAAPKLSPMEDTFMTRKDIWKHRLGFVIKMTSGVVYSIMIHSVIITAYALLIFRIFYTNGFDLDLLRYVCGPIIFSYLIFGVLEVAVRWFCNDQEPLIITKSGHFAHLIGCNILGPYIYMAPLNPIEGLVLPFVWASLVFWTFFVLIASGILALLEDDSLTRPLV